MYAPLAALVLALGLACAGGSDDSAVVPDGTLTPEPVAPTPTTVEGEQGQDVVVVPVPEEGSGTHWCCEYSEDGVTKFALTADKSACESSFSSKGARWVDGAQCIPCCCKSPNDEGNLDLGYSFALTTPGACASSGECVPMGDDTCAEKADAETTTKPAPRPNPGPRPPTREMPKPPTREMKK